MKTWSSRGEACASCEARRKLAIGLTAVEASPRERYESSSGIQGGLQLLCKQFSIQYFLRWKNFRLLGI